MYVINYRNIYLRKVFFCSCLIIFSIVTAQSQDNENEFWMGMQIEFELSKDLDFEYEQEIRLRNSGKNMKNSIASYGFQYDLHKYVDLALAYRYNLYTDKKQHELRPTIYLEYEIDRFEFQLRSRYDKEYRVDDNNRVFWRNKFAIDYNLKGPVNPYLSSEAFYRFNWDEGDRFLKYKLSVGVEINLDNGHELDIFYRYENEFNIEEPDIERILAFYYKYSFELH